MSIKNTFFLVILLRIQPYIVCFDHLANKTWPDHVSTGFYIALAFRDSFYFINRVHIPRFNVSWNQSHVNVSMFVSAVSAPETPLNSSSNTIGTDFLYSLRVITKDVFLAKREGILVKPPFHDAVIERIRSIKIEAVCGLYDHSNEYTVFSCDVVQKQLCVDRRKYMILYLLKYIYGCILCKITKKIVFLIDIYYE